MSEEDLELLGARKMIDICIESQISDWSEAAKTVQRHNWLQLFLYRREKERRTSEQLAIEQSGGEEG